MMAWCRCGAASPCGSWRACSMRPGCPLRSSVVRASGWWPRGGATMYVVDRIHVGAKPERTLEVAVGVERWPEFLRHYRWVRVLERTAGHSVVEMAAWRPFGVLRYPVWWVSEMMVDASAGR